MSSGVESERVSEGLQMAIDATECNAKKNLSVPESEVTKGRFSSVEIKGVALKADNSDPRDLEIAAIYREL